jgi:8-oxo-dGTP pyrophosphatase MutT (NUDIX family)
MDDMDNQKLQCAGFLIFNDDYKKTVMVKTYKGNLSFPKGKRKKKEKNLEAAYRELEEETGLTKDMVDVVDELFIDEVSNKGNINVRYFVALCKDENHKFVFDEDELEEVKWYKCKKLIKIKNLKNSRKTVLSKVLKILNVKNEWNCED